MTHCWLLLTPLVTFCGSLRFLASSGPSAAWAAAVSGSVGRAAVRNTPCYAYCVTNTRFTISTAPGIQAAIRAHAEAAGLDVSAYMVAAAIAQMAADDAASAVFAPLDEENAAAMEEGATMSPPPLPAFEDLTAEEQALVRRVISSALGTGEVGAA